MYESFFKLRIKPFDLLPDPQFIYLSKSHKKVLTYLNYGIRERAGFILLTGEIGTGKTTLIRDLLNKQYERVVLAKIFNTRVTSDQLLALINDDFGLSVQGKDKVSLIRDLNTFLVEQYASGNHPILIIDEAQNLSAELLEEIRMLSNLETNDSKLLQIILVGQPELLTSLASPGLLQLRQRISINCHIQTLDRQETAQYIEHRLAVAGNAKAVVFPPETLDCIYQYSRGIPRLINIICDFLMLSAFAEEINSISIDMARDVIDDLDFENHYWSTAVVGKEYGRVPDSTTSPGGETPIAFSEESHLLLLDIKRRIESIENVVAPVLESLKEQRDQLAALQNAFMFHVDEIDSQVASFKKKLDKTILTGGTGVAQSAPHDPASTGIIRRIFGSDSSSK